MVGSLTHTFILRQFTRLSICPDLDNEFPDNEDPELNLVSLSKTKHSGYSNYELPPLIREPEDRKLMRNKHSGLTEPLLGHVLDHSFVSQMSLEVPTFREEWS